MSDGNSPDKSSFDEFKKAAERTEIQRKLAEVNISIQNYRQQVSQEKDDKRRASLESSLNLALAAKTTLEMKLSTL